MADLRAIALGEGSALTGAQVLADHIRANGQVWNDCPILWTYYNLRLSLGILHTSSATTTRRVFYTGCGKRQARWRCRTLFRTFFAVWWRH